MQNEIAKMAEQFGVSADSLQQCSDYVIDRARAHPDVFAADPEAFVSRAMMHYKRIAEEYYQEVLDNPTRMQELLQQLAKELVEHHGDKD